MELLQSSFNLATAIGAVIVLLGLLTTLYMLLKSSKSNGCDQDELDQVRNGGNSASLLPACGAFRFTSVTPKSNKELAKIGLYLRFWWILVGVIVVSLLVSQKILFIFLAFLCFLTLKEFLSITPTRQADRRVLFLAYLVIPIQFYWIWIDAYSLFLVFIPIYVFLFLPLAMALMGETRGFLNACGTLNWGIMATVFGLGHLAYLLVLPLSGSAVAGMGLVLFLLVLTQLNDAAQYLIGNLWGRRKIMPKVSSSKSWAGLIGGIVVTGLAAWIAAPLITPFATAEAIAVGILVALSGFVGYMTITAIKRDLQLKDRATMIPGRGGMMNRVGTLIYTAPLFFHIVYFLEF